MNKTSTVKVFFGGKVMPLKTLCEHQNLDIGAVQYRLKKGMSLEQAIEDTKITFKKRKRVRKV